MPPPKSDKIQFEIFILFIILDKFYDLIYIHRLDFVCALIADFPVFVDNRHRISDIGGAALEIEFFVYLGRARVIAGRNIPGLFVVGDPNLYSENSVRFFVAGMDNGLKSRHTAKNFGKLFIKSLVPSIIKFLSSSSKVLWEIFFIKYSKALNSFAPGIVEVFGNIMFKTSSKTNKVLFGIFLAIEIFVENNIGMISQVAVAKGYRNLKIGSEVISIWNTRVEEIRSRFPHMRTVVLVKSDDLLTLRVFEVETKRYDAETYDWIWNKRGNLEGYKNQVHCFTWQPHGSQFTIVEPIPTNHIDFQLMRPQKLDMNQVLKAAGFDNSWITVLNKE